MNKYDIYLIYRITNWQKWYLCVLRLRQKSSNSRHKASTAPNLPSCTNSFRVICPTSRSTFCTKWQMEMEIQNTLKRYSNGTVNECRLFHDHEHICSKWMKQCNMFLSFLKNGRGKKKGVRFVRVLHERHPGSWRGAADQICPGSGGLKVNWKWICWLRCVFCNSKKSISECLISAHPAGIDKVLRSFNETGKHCEHWMLDMLDAWVLSRDAATCSTVL